MSEEQVDETLRMKPFVRYGAATERGIRSENQDSYLARPELVMATFAVADGVGGHQFGGQASRLTIDALNSELDSNRDYSPDYVTLLMKKKYEQINTYIFEDAWKRNVVTATTLSMLNIFKDSMILSNVGDTKVFRIRDGEIHCISDIQTAAWEEFKDGKIRREEIESNPYRHVLTQALGADKTIQPYMKTEATRSLDIYLICSDGLYNFMASSRLLQIFDHSVLLSNKQLEALCIQCVHEALVNQSDDNVTLLAVQIV
ncbi:PP2C family protein-serine/threonine phosphatase [Sporolactobacillus vineae]|uniref:PP2C family protein-serine/threonine phosphatase n=1 Tax=Sporolactobacillus vineae TaxID=444463 RepID=UPI00028A3751|nr:protein phosphatase 2C domain-containing protein [Sporolactobacillus vineae]